ncbi:MAG TPA: hypothetical protein VKT18_00830, partial [Acidimicrobiales bacterium]|nr:hypothetical protein [Acidimicrobiales bacterium]
MRRLLLHTALAACCLAAAAGAAQAGGVRSVGAPRAIAVSVPAEPVPARLGRALRTLIRIVNPNTTSVRVTVASRRLLLGDDGKVSIAAVADPRWSHAVGFPSHPLVIPAQGYRDVRLVVRVPNGLAPDLYFVGFVVTPVAATGGSIKVVNQVGSFLTLDVPGPRLRRLSGHLRLPGFVLGSHVDGSLRLTNTGRASLSFYGETDTTSSPGGSFRQVRLDPSLLPAGRSRTVTFSGKPRWPVGIVTVTTRIVYPGRTAAETR